MIINEPGNYILKYTATDECGNSSVVERGLEVTQITYRTVLYTDGTLIINESSRDQAANEALHGVATNVYAPFDQNGVTDAEKYIFNIYTSVLWYSERLSITYVEIGSRIKPASTKYWFYGLTNSQNFNLANLDTSDVTDMSNMFNGASSVKELDLQNFDTSNVTSFDSMFRGCTALESVDVSSFNTNKATTLARMFQSCSSLKDIDCSGFDYSATLKPSLTIMFYGCSSVEVIRAFYRTVVVSSDIANMFSNCSALKTIYAKFRTNNSYPDVFTGDTNLVGGAGTVWQSRNTSSTYARVDNPPDTPGYFTEPSA